MRIFWILIALSIALTTSVYAWPFSKKVKNIDLGNPTSYEFSFSKEQVIEKLKSIFDKRFDDGWKTYEYEGKLYLGVASTHESPYHVPQFKINPDDGGEGTMSIDFFIDLESLTNNKTKVTLRPEFYEIQTGEAGKWIPHGRHPVRKAVPTSTFFEYTFLLKLGELLGEKNMPPINTDPTKGNVIIS